MRLNIDFIDDVSIVSCSNYAGQLPASKLRQKTIRKGDKKTVIKLLKEDKAEHDGQLYGDVKPSCETVKYDVEETKLSENPIVDRSAHITRFIRYSKQQDFNFTTATGLKKAKEKFLSLSGDPVVNDSIENIVSIKVVK